MTRIEPVEDRFRRYTPVRPADGCWPWQGTILLTGYGQIWTGSARMSAHRFSYELHHGPVPAGMVVMHACDNPPCVNPRHLRAGTPADNAHDRDQKGRLPGGAAHHRVNRRLTEDDVRAIRARRGAGELIADIAIAFGVDKSAVSKIANRRAWAWLDTEVGG